MRKKEVLKTRIKDCAFSSFNSNNENSATLTLLRWAFSGLLTDKILSADSNYIVDLSYRIFGGKGCSWFKLNNLGLPLGANLKFHTSVAKGLNLEVRTFWELIPTFVEVTGTKLVRGAFLAPFLHPEKG